jgi:hypothetical protein
VPDIARVSPTDADDRPMLPVLLNGESRPAIRSREGRYPLSL